MPDPVKDGQNLSEPTDCLFPRHASPEPASLQVMVFVASQSRPQYLLTVLWNEDLWRPTLKDHLELLQPQPEHLNSSPSNAGADADVGTLALIPVLAAKTQ